MTTRGWPRSARSRRRRRRTATVRCAAAENYDELSLPQLRARLRRFSVAELTELLEYERAQREPAVVRRHADPPDRHRARSAVSEPTTTPERPWPVRTVARKIAEWINRLGDIWVEGQVTQISNRPGTGTAFLTLRDPAADVSMTVTCATALLREQPLPDGTRVILHARPGLLHRPRHAQPAGRRDPRGRHRRAARAHRAAAQAPRRGRDLRPAAQAAAAVPAAHGRPDHRPRVGRGEGRADQRPGAVAGGPVPGGERRRAGCARGAADRRRTVRFGQRPERRGDRDRPRRRQRRGPAAVLRRDAAARGRPAAARRCCPRSATSRTRRCSTTWPTCAARRRPTRASGWCRTSPRSPYG